MPWRLGSMPVHPVQRVQGLSEMNPRTLRFHIPGGNVIAVRFTPRDATRRTCSLGCPERFDPLRADASMATPANAPPPRVSDVSWTSLAKVREQYMSVSGAVRSGRRCPTLLEAKGLKSDKV